MAIKNDSDVAFAPVVLLVDDEKDFVDALAFRLENRGMTCLTAYKGEEAFALLEKPEIEVVLLDMNMPGLSGLDLLLRIKELRADVEVLFLTGEVDFSAISQAMRRGASDYLVKPISMEALMGSLEKARKRVAGEREKTRMRQSQRLMALGSLAAGVGHEINNPLQLIMQYAGLLKDILADMPKTSSNNDYFVTDIQTLAEKIENQARRCGAITAQLLELADKRKAGTASVYITDLFAHTCQQAQVRANELHVALVQHIPDPTMSIAASLMEMEIVVDHIMRNALDSIEAMQSAGAITQGKVELRAEKRADTIAIYVTDTGEGFYGDAAIHAFDPFFTTRPVGKGVGLGLTVSVGIVNSLEGTLTIMASKETHGATVKIEVPIAPA